MYGGGGGLGTYMSTLVFYVPLNWPFIFNLHTTRVGGEGVIWKYYWQPRIPPSRLA